MKAIIKVVIRIYSLVKQKDEEGEKVEKEKVK